VRETALGEAANFVGGGLDPVGGVGAGAKLCVFKGSASGWIDDTYFELRSEIYDVERGGEVTCELATVTKTGLVLVLRRRVGGSFLGVGGRCCCSQPRKWGEARWNGRCCGWWWCWQ
jgi:hypothetical protein